jgi:UDP-N-acetylglucosamine 2-epimerase (non-hydrolysing)
LSCEKPDLILVQGDTTTAFIGAVAGFYHRIPIGHIEAGLRSGNPYSPYPEEMNRRLVTRLATYHFAATPHNCAALLSEGVPQENIFVTGNPIIDALHTVLKESMPSPPLAEWLTKTQGLRRLILTTHRRESFGRTMAENLQVIRRFVELHEDIVLAFPVHPNPAVVAPATTILSGHPRICLMQPLIYQDFIALLSHAWLIVSDSGGVQEEAPTLGKPLLILRENTERPEAVTAGTARLVGGSPIRLATMLEEVYVDGAWARQIQHIENPFGCGDSGERIVQAIAAVLGMSGGLS